MLIGIKIDSASIECPGCGELIKIERQYSEPSKLSSFQCGHCSRFVYVGIMASTDPHYFSDHGPGLDLWKSLKDIVEHNKKGARHERR